MNIYDRQKSLDLKIPKAVAILGVGGVGSWVALDLALVGVPKLLIADDDVIEEHNLNRTPFTLSQVGMEKTLAMVQLITERRPNTFVLPLNSSVDNRPDLMKANNVEYIIDCRDKLEYTPLMEEFPYVKLGYDGKEITIDFYPKVENLWDDGEPVRYRITPSYLVPPQLLAAFITEIIVSGKFPADRKPRTVSLNVEKLIEEVILDEER